jgi:hypothetical protein
VPCGTLGDDGVRTERPEAGVLASSVRFASASPRDRRVNIPWYVHRFAMSCVRARCAITSHHKAQKSHLRKKTFIKKQIFTACVAITNIYYIFNSRFNSRVKVVHSGNENCSKRGMSTN